MNRTAALTLTVALLAHTCAASLTLPAAPSTVDTDAERAAWTALMSSDGEYAAVAAYSAVIARYGPVEPYVSILRAEQNHVRALTRQLQRYGVAVPTNPYLGRMPAPTNLRVAAQAWADGEVLNVKMYDDLAILATGDTQLQKVFGNLRAASLQVHLPLFREAAAAGGTLTAAQLGTLRSPGGGPAGPNR